MEVPLSVVFMLLYGNDMLYAHYDEIYVATIAMLILLTEAIV